MKAFGRWAKKEGLTDDTLLQAIDDADKGIIAADLGDEVVKLRIAREGQGKSGGYRSVVALKAKDRAFFLEGWAKNDFENINDNHLKLMKSLAKKFFAYSDDALQTAIDGGTIREIARPVLAVAVAEQVEHASEEAEQIQ